MSLSQRVSRWTGRLGLGRKVTVVLALAALASGFATYAAMAGIPPFGPNGGSVLLLLNINLVLLLARAAAVAKRPGLGWAHRRRGLAGSRLPPPHVLLVTRGAGKPTRIVRGF